MMKRAADIAAPVAASLLGAARVDLSAGGVAFAQVLTSAARHSKPEVRSAAQQCMAHLAARVSDADVAGVIAKGPLVSMGLGPSQNQERYFVFSLVAHS